jgi:hypothetical protein
LGIERRSDVCAIAGSQSTKQNHKRDDSHQILPEQKALTSASIHRSTIPSRFGHHPNEEGRSSKRQGFHLARFAWRWINADQRVLRAIARNLLFLAQQPEMAALPAIRVLTDRLDGKPKQEAEVTLRQAVARELSDDDLAAIAVGGEDEEIEPDPKPDSSKLN